MTMPAGWYTDPVDANVERYWDGTAWGEGPDAVRGQPVTARSAPSIDRPVLVANPVPKPSAHILVAALLCLILGPLSAGLFGGAFSATARDVEGAVAATVFGFLILTVGLVLLVIGVHRLASGVDHLVARENADRGNGSRSGG